MRKGMQITLGFTLLEVLVALAIVSITLAATIKVSGEFGVNAAYLKEKTFAQWVAENKAEEYRLAGTLPATGKQQGDEEMAERVWRWQVTVSNTDDTRLRRLDIVVTDEKGDYDQPITTLVAFVAAPL
jgi:general secretion pathway protein I